MKKPISRVAIAAVLLQSFACVSMSLAQAPVHSTIAVIDLKQVFEGHTRFQAMRDQLMRDVEGAENTVKAQQEELRGMVEQFREYRQGTPEYKKMEADIANRQADLKVDISIRKKDFMEREAKIHYHVYQEVLQEIQHFATQRGLNLVMRVNTEEVKDGNPQQILQELNKPVVYFNKAIDITYPILNTLNQRAGGRVPAGAAARAPRQGVPGTATRPQGVRPPRRQ